MFSGATAPKRSQGKRPDALPIPAKAATASVAGRAAQADAGGGASAQLIGGLRLCETKRQLGVSDVHF
ncbi:hypothetical protein MRX96_033284 [Rhipicephalus microplus]